MEFYEIKCSEDIMPIECVNPRRNIWAVRWNLHPDENNEWSALEALSLGRPSIDTIRSSISDFIDSITQDRIVNGFVWNDIPIKLTDAAQRNFLFALFHLNHTGIVDRESYGDLLVSDSDEEAAIELRDMVASMWQHIKECRADGILRKNQVDYTRFS